MTVLLVILAVTAGAVLGWAILAALARTASPQASRDLNASDLHGSNANFGNSLKGDNGNFGRCFYEE